MLRRTERSYGFTLIELIVVITLISLLLTLAVPRYFASIDKGRKTVQLQNLLTIRDSIDKFFADTGRYPESLSELVTRRYLRAMPVDPVTEKSDWIIVPPPAAPGSSPVASGNVYDVISNTPPIAPSQ